MVIQGTHTHAHVYTHAHINIKEPQHTCANTETHMHTNVLVYTQLCTRSWPIALIRLIGLQSRPETARGSVVQEEQTASASW